MLTADTPCSAKSCLAILGGVAPFQAYGPSRHRQHPPVD